MNALWSMIINHAIIIIWCFFVLIFYHSDKGEMCVMKEVTLFSDDPKSKESARQLGQV
jgi:hypothetical protein